MPWHECRIGTLWGHRIPRGCSSFECGQSPAPTLGESSQHHGWPAILAKSSVGRWRTHIVGIDVIGVTKRIDCFAPAQWLVDYLDHAHPPELWRCVYKVRNPSQPFDGSAIIVFIVEVGIGIVLAGKGLVGNLSAGAAMKAGRVSKEADVV